MLPDLIDLLTGARCPGCDRPGWLPCPDCGAALRGRAVATRPEPPPPGFALAWTAGEYADPLRALLLGHKEHQQFGLRRLLGELLAEAVRGLATSQGVPPSAQLILVPVPSQPASIRLRGHDPTYELVRCAARSLGSSARAVRLLSVARVLDQAGLDREARAVNLSGSMWVPTGRLRRLAGGRGGSRAGAERGWVVVCDDVLTTGATAREAQRALSSVGLHLLGVATVAATRRRWRFRSQGSEISSSGNLHGTSLAMRPATD